MIAARPIRFTADLAAHRRYLRALGATTVVTAPGWEVYALGSGRLALHESSEAQPPGQTVLGWEVPNLDAWVAQATAAGVALTVGETGHGRAATVTAPDGTTFTVDPAPSVTKTVESSATEEPPADTSLAVLPIWYVRSADVDGARQVITGLGAVQRVAADSDVWTDFLCPGGGLAAVHVTEGEPGVELAFEFDGDVETLIPVLAEAGVEAVLIDETYSRTLQLADPDRPGATLWINERQQDLYGYSSSEGAG